MKELEVCEECGSNDVCEQGDYIVNINTEYNMRNIDFNATYFYCYECNNETGVILLSEWVEEERAKFIGEPDENQA